MKHCLLLLIGSLLYFLNSQTFAQTNHRFAGKWQNDDSLKLIGHITFIDSVNLFVDFSGQGVIECNYIVDTTKSPIWFDLSIKGSNDGKLLKGLVRFIDETTMKWQLYLGIDRPGDFLNEAPKNTVILKKKL